MAEDMLKQLLVAFDNVPYKGLYLWQSLLLPAEVNYEDLLKKSFIPENRFRKNSKVKKIQECLRQMRTEVLAKEEIKAKVIAVRDVIISTLSHDLIMNQIKKNLKKEETLEG